MTTRAPLPTRLRPHGPTTFVDRTEQRAALREAFGATATGRERRAVFVLGEPGIGKTRLVSEFAGVVHEAGTLVVAGRCDDGLELPYQPFVEALEHLVEHAPAELLAAHVQEHGDRVARLVPALRRHGAAAAQPEGESERYLLYAAIEDLLLAAAREAPLLLVLEDLHWADLPTVRLLRRLLTSPRSGSLMVLATCRSSELDAGHPLRALLADLHREVGVLRLELDGLETEHVSDLLRGLGGDAPAPQDGLAAALQQNTNGNPFFITELVRNLAESGEDELPVSIAETLGQRIGRLGDDVTRVLGAAAVIGVEFDLDLLAAVAGEEEDVAAAVDRAVAGALVAELGGVRFRFAHALVQRYLYSELGGARRTELHRRTAVALERRLAGGPVSVAELARHAVAGVGTDVEKALSYADLAGQEALAKLAPDEARRWYDVALDLAARRREPREDERCALLICRGEAERLAGVPAFRETLLEAAGIARRTGDPAALVRAALLNTRGMQSETGVVDTERIAMLEAALEVVGDADSPERARLLATSGAELMYSGEWERQVALSDAALAVARRLQDPEALLTVLNMRYVTLLAPAKHAERQANTAEAIGVAGVVGDPLAEFYAYHWRVGVSLEAGDFAEARTWMAREQEVARRLRQPTTLWLTHADEANVALIEGRLDDAARLIQETFDIGQGTEPDALACFMAHQTCLWFETGALGGLAAAVRQVVEQNPGIPGFRSTLALALAEAGELDEARAVLAVDAASGFTELAYDVTWTTVACVYAHVASVVGDTEAAARLYELLLPWRALVAYPYIGAWGPVEHYLGHLALTLGDEDGARGHLEAAAAVNARAGAAGWARRTDALLARVRKTS